MLSSASSIRIAIPADYSGVRSSSGPCEGRQEGIGSSLTGVTLFERQDLDPPGPRVRVRATIAYDGAAFRGFAAQPGLRTVAGVLNERLTRIFGHRVEITGAGRTDRGVHAWGQVIHVDLDPRRLDLDRLGRSIDSICGPELVVRSLDLAPHGFDARFSAVSRTYRYRVLNRAAADPLGRHSWWHVPAPLDLAVLRLACDPLLGVQDFSSFCRRDRSRADEPLIRLISRSEWHDAGDGRLIFEIEGSAFCHQMVRSVVGTLVDMGRGRRRPGEMRSILAARDRGAASSPAPPHGLVLWAVNYP